jgi:hypothetical protein
MLKQKKKLHKRSLPATLMRFPWEINTHDGYNTKEQPWLVNPGIV